ncbi:putative 2OG-Fe(II) oxygenase [Azospirillum sp. sgz301742]
MDADLEGVASPGAEEAFRRILKGNEEGGLRLYKQALSNRDAGRIPVGVHISMMRQAGRAAIADVMEQTGRLFGHDLALSSAMPGVSAERRMSEYRALFARGQVNARMLAGYADALSDAGDAANLADLMDPARLRVVEADWTMPDGSGRPLRAAVDELLAASKDKAEWREAVMSVRNMHYLPGALDLDHPTMRFLVQCIRREVESALAALTFSNPLHRLAHWPSKTYTLNSWAMYSDGAGYNTQHHHPRGMLTGVYYVAGDYGENADPGDGALRFGPSPTGRAECEGWPSAVIPAVPGTLLLMPSYYTHFTLPVGRPIRRVVIPFDVVERLDTGE